MNSDKLVDIVMLVIFMAFAITILAFYTDSLSKSIDFGVENKSTVETKVSLGVGDNTKTGKDLLMSLALTDDFVMYPRAIRINDTPVIELTDEWILNRASQVAKIYDVSGSYKLANMLDYSIESVMYVESGDGGYLQYRLVP